MRLPRFLVLLLSLLLLVACRGGNAASPTPFPTPGATATPGAAGPISLTVTELMAAPGLYRDTVVQLTGQLRKQPLIVCDSDLHPSPASWGLAEEGLLAPAGGFDQQVRALLPDDLTMTVEGRWRRWEGLVGCGKQARQQEVWYLETGRIISPAPLTQVTLTPGGEIAISAVTSTPTAEIEGIGGGESSPSPEALATPSLPEATPPPGEYPGDTEGTPDIDLPSPTTVVDQTPGGLTPAATPDPATTPTVSGTAATPGTVTGTPGTPTPTITGTPPTPTATGTGGSGQVVAKGNLYDELFGDFLTSSLAAGVTDSWDLDIFAEDSMYIHVVAPPPADLVVSVLKDGQPIVNRQNSAPVGSAEFINDPPLQGEGVYEIQISALGGEATDYAISFYTSQEFPLIIPGIIASGTPRTAVQLPEGALHFWFFVGRAGDQVTIRLDPLDNGDGILYLYGPDADEIETEGSGDEGFEGEEEFLEATLSEDGLFAIGIEEIGSEVMSYDLALAIE